MTYKAPKKKGYAQQRFIASGINEAHLSAPYSSNYKFECISYLNTQNQ